MALGGRRKSHQFYKISPFQGARPRQNLWRPKQAPAAEARKLRPADGPENFSLSLRCITFGLPNTFAGYNSYYQFFLRQWLGDSRGRWEGDTLVVDTVNFVDAAANGTSALRVSGDQNLHLIEWVVELYCSSAPMNISGVIVMLTREPSHVCRERPFQQVHLVERTRTGPWQIPAQSSPAAPGPPGL